MKFMQPALLRESQVIGIISIVTGRASCKQKHHASTFIFCKTLTAQVLPVSLVLTGINRVV